MLNKRGGASTETPPPREVKNDGIIITKICNFGKFGLLFFVAKFDAAQGLSYKHQIQTGRIRTGLLCGYRDQNKSTRRAKCAGFSF